MPAYFSRVVLIACLLLGRSAKVQADAALPVEVDDRSARVVAIHAAEPALELSFKGKDYKFPLRIPLLDTRTSRPLSLAQVGVGDRITFVAQPMNDRRLQIVSIVVLVNEDNDVVGKRSAAHGSNKPGDDLSGNPGGAPPLPTAAPVSPFE